MELCSQRQRGDIENARKQMSKQQQQQQKKTDKQILMDQTKNKCFQNVKVGKNNSCLVCAILTAGGRVSMCYLAVDIHKGVRCVEKLERLKTKTMKALCSSIIVILNRGVLGTTV